MEVDQAACEPFTSQTRRSTSCPINDRMSCRIGPIQVRVEGVSVPIRVMVELGKKKAVASAFDWPGWDRGAKSEAAALEVLATYRSQYAKVAALGGRAEEFATTLVVEVVERVKGTGTTDFYGLSARWAEPEQQSMSEAECERKIALLRACWAYFDEVASVVSAELRKVHAEEVETGIGSCVTRMVLRSSNSLRKSA
jgi:hypothetical protein